MRQGRTDAWIAHQLEVSAKDVTNFKSDHDLEAGETEGVETDLFGPRVDEEEVDLRAEDEALVAAALEKEAEREAEREDDEDDDEQGDGEPAQRGDGDGDADGDGKSRRRRGRRGGRGRKRGGGGGGGGGKALEGTFDHGDDGYGLWLDPAIQDDPLYAEHWAGHRSVKITVEAERIVIERS